MKYIIGAYATAPSLSIENRLVENKFYDKLIESIPELRGLEIPKRGKGIHFYGSNFLIDIINPSWDNVLTCIPGTMSSLSKNPKFGLASDDKQGRIEALNMHKRANQKVKDINDKCGRKSFIAIQIASAPSKSKGGVSSSINSLIESLDEILSWDWEGAKIVIEHCDTFIKNQSFEKGFLTLEDEIRVLSRFHENYEVGITINWGRSAIEGKNPSKPIVHLRKAIKMNMLSGLMFSGTSSNDKVYGSWTDTHMPFAQSYNLQFFEQNSLLTLKNIQNTLKVVNLDNLDYLGVKLLSMPLNIINIERRVGLNRDAISILNQLLK